jgi:lipopolysaccharide export LptBFGC system permease protein LptF
MALRSDQNDPERVGRKLKELTFKDLVRERKRLAEEGIETMPVSLELHRKVASSFAALVFVAFGLALGLRLQHQERLISFVWILSIFVLYYLGSIGMNAIALKGWLPPWLAMWTPNLVGGMVSALMIASAVRR